MMGSEFRPWAGSSELGLEGGSLQGRRRGRLRRLSAPPAAGQGLGFKFPSALPVTVTASDRASQ